MIRLRAAFLGLAASSAFGWAISARLSSLLDIHGPPVVASSGKLSEHDLEVLNRMTPQQQAERLLEKAINHYGGAGEEMSKRLEKWQGAIQTSPELERLTNTAYFSNDLRVRAMALELWLVRDGIRKTPEAVEQLVAEAGADDGRAYFRLSTLGILGNRGVEPRKALETLRAFLRDPSGERRSGAINGLGLLGTEETIAPLLEAMRWDASFDLRERAACNLADSGMLPPELRRKAVPHLIQFTEDATLDALTRKWSFQALREIAQQGLPDDAAAWRNWYAAQPAR
jgi:HEAT repeat protein